MRVGIKEIESLNEMTTALSKYLTIEEYEIIAYVYNRAMEREGGCECSED